MNVIVIVSDTLRRDHLGAYGNSWIRTPYLDRFAQDAQVFENAYQTSFPTVPTRFDILTGRYNFIHYRWGPLPPSEVVLADVLSKSDYTTGFVVDTPHIMQHGYNYSRGFTSFEWIRGQENDHYRASPKKVVFPCDPSKLRSPHYSVTQYLRNVSERHREEDYFPAQTMTTAARWLERNHKENFFLYVDTFDPHEPWDPPKHYGDLYDPGYSGENVFYPRYGRCDYLTQAELKHCRAMYAGEVTLVDRWIGHLIERVDDLGLRDNTAVIVTTDHGFYLGEHGLIGKSMIFEPPNPGSAAVPLYDEVCHIPLMVRMPGRTGRKRMRARVQLIDMMPTILDLCEVKNPGTTQGQSFAKMLQGAGPDELREFTVTAHPLASAGKTWCPATIVTDEWALIYGGPEGAFTGKAGGSGVQDRAVDSIARELRMYGDGTPELYHLPDDPTMTKNVYHDNKSVAAGLHQKFLKLIVDNGAKPEHVQALGRL
ncbi:MAG: sulfatase [Planctomycetes bacterium]|nr:sulfatase [Planctomycetota bacterium]